MIKNRLQTLVTNKTLENINIIIEIKEMKISEYIRVAIEEKLYKDMQELNKQ